MKFKNYIDEAEKTQFEYQECGNKFKKNMGPKTYEVKCPKYKSTDVEVV